MKLLICLITYNRIEFSKKTLDNLLNTVKIPHHIIVVDNNSTDGTREWLEKEKRVDQIVLNPDNYYPGKACNIGWEKGLNNYPEATHLMRLDNDMHLEKGWDTKAQEYFEKIPDLGQLGIEHEAIESPEAERKVLNINGMKLNPFPGCVGGPCIISRKVWDRGIKYREFAWRNEGDMPTPQEDSYFSLDINKAGFAFGHMTERLAWTFANAGNWDLYPDYYKKTMEERGYKKQFPWLFKEDA